MSEIQERRRTKLRDQHRHEKRWQQLRVHSVRRIHDQFVRIDFDYGSEEIESHGFDDVLVLCFPLVLSTGAKPTEPDGVHDYATREYSVRCVDTKNHLVTVDFLVHQHGVATRWAQNARPNQRLWCIPPRMCKGYAEASATYLFADPSALPAVSRFHSEARETPGHTVLVDAQFAKGTLKSSPRRGLTFLDIQTPPDRLIEASRLGGRTEHESSFIWIAGEAHWAAGLRKVLVQDYAVNKENIQFTGYWKFG
ncbi:NADPH-dependent ferric siderophore reductase, contains FAD-binding and SIP domains [Arthrobacter sp. NIO-1057]|nr:NADPH-dependent ferric siderophore reductase, contains FAD-binding and SIP domains [Arthrobacter sp. NIO-1057]